MPYSLALTNSAVYAFSQSDHFGKGIVLFLIGVSIFLWTTMFNKSMQLKKVMQENDKFEKLFSKTQSVVDLVTEESADSALQRIYTTGIFKLMSVCNKGPNEAIQYCQERRIPRELSRDEADVIVECIESEMNKEILTIEKDMGYIATIVGTSPFLGLLGTVWGVMAAFVGMAQQNSADIGALAPGISGALLTTVCGLLVAIPSVIGYNLINTKINNSIILMENFVSEFRVKLQTENSQIIREGN